MPVEEIEAKNFFSFMYFHSPSAAQPHGWPILMEERKVRCSVRSPAGMTAECADGLLSVARLTELNGGFRLDVFSTSYCAKQPGFRHIGLNLAKGDFPAK